MNFGVAEQGVHPLQSLGGLSEDTGSADRSIQTVCDSQEDFSCFVIPLGDVGFQGFCEALVSGLVALDDLTAEFIDDKQVVVFKKNPGLKAQDFFFC